MDKKVLLVVNRCIPNYMNILSKFEVYDLSLVDAELFPCVCRWVFLNKYESH